MNLPFGKKNNSQVVDLASFKNRDAAIGKLLLDAGKLKQAVQKYLPDVFARLLTNKMRMGIPMVTF